MSDEEFPKKELETLWAPWRVEYFEREPRDRDFLATAGRASDDAEHLVITRRKNAFLMMNRYPYTVGHLMVVRIGKSRSFLRSARMRSLSYGIWSSMHKRFCVPR